MEHYPVPIVCLNLTVVKLCSACADCLGPGTIFFSPKKEEVIGRHAVVQTACIHC